MRKAAPVVGIVGLIMLVVLIRRLTEAGGPGPKTWAFCAATVIVLIAAAVMWFRGPRELPPTSA